MEAEALLLTIRTLTIRSAAGTKSPLTCVDVKVGAQVGAIVAPTRWLVAIRFDRGVNHGVNTGYRESQTPQKAYGMPRVTSERSSCVRCESGATKTAQQRTTYYRVDQAANTHMHLE